MLIIVVVLLLMVNVASVSAVGNMQLDPGVGDPYDFMSMMQMFMSLAGTGGLIAAIINALKTFNVVQSDNVGKWVLGANAIGFLLLVISRIFVPQLNVEEIDSFAGSIATVIVAVLGFVVQAGFSKVGHSALKGMPVIGKSFTSDIEHNREQDIEKYRN